MFSLFFTHPYHIEELLLFLVRIEIGVPWSESCSVVSQPRSPKDRTQVSRIVGGFFTSLATRHPQEYEFVAYPFSNGSFRPRNPTRVSYIAGRFFTNWAIREEMGVDINRIESIFSH